MQIEKTNLPQCFVIHPRVMIDQRGSFAKVFHKDTFEAHNLETNYTEQYFSHSHKGVLRGMHFQLPPMEHAKLVYCIYGKVLDVVVDLRKGSPAFKKHQAFELDDQKQNALYIPPGLAHGFLTLSEKAIMVYNVSTVYSPEHDSGIKWDSIGFSWPVESPIISARDQKFVQLADFDSPFQYIQEGAE
ncbi:dTDP-4-dehydrorhamnose 3,5-epimerase [Peptococcaceae bacterium]|nr:dTDP-4-dehydrorhamnose 3,5-epimerase [Peptococcaceae bacterium]